MLKIALGRRHVVPLLASAMVASGVALAPIALAADTTTTRLEGATSAVPESLLQQDIRWQACPANMPNPSNPGQSGDLGLECGYLLAPLDWYNPNNGQTVQLAVTRMKSSVGKPRLLVANPGGPGLPGLGMSLLMKAYEFDRTHTLVDMDMRGSGNSTSITCGGVGRGVNDPRDRSEGNLTSISMLAQVTADQCKSAHGGLSKYITTEQMTADLDLLRNVLKFQQLDFYGTSAGAWLGAHYQKYFGANAGRFVFDSTPDATLTWQQNYEARPDAMWMVYQGVFAGWVAQRNAAFGLGSDANAVMQYFEKLRKDFGTAPLRMSTWGMGQKEIDAVGIDSAVATSLRSKDQWTNLAYLLGAARQMWDAQQAGGEPTPKLVGERRAAAVRQQMRDALPVATAPYGADSSAAVYNAVTCQDTEWQQGRQVAERVAGDLGGRYPLTGFYPVQNPCYYWKTTTPRRQVPDGSQNPTVILQSEFDPVTPFPQAEDFARKYRNATMVTVKADGDHRVVGRGNGCIDDALLDFIGAGKVPTVLSCQGAGIPEPTRRAGGRYVADLRSLTSVAGAAFAAAMPKK